MKRLQVLFTHAIFISCCAVALAFQTVQVLHLQVSDELYLLIFLSTCCSYNLYRLISLFPFEQMSEWPQFFKQHITSVILLLFGGSGMLYCLTREQHLLIDVIIATVMTLGYCLPLFPLSSPGFFQRNGFLKTILLAATWAFVTVFWPISATGISAGHIVWVLFLLRFSFMFILCIIFDARDQVVDQLRSLGSLVTTVSPFILKSITMLALVTYAVTAILLGFWLRHPGLAVAWLLIGLLTLYFYQLSKNRKGYWFYYFGVDGLMLLSAFATFLATI